MKAEPDFDLSQANSTEAILLANGDRLYLSRLDRFDCIFHRPCKNCGEMLVIRTGEQTFNPFAALPFAKTAIQAMEERCAADKGQHQRARK